MKVDIKVRRRRVWMHKGIICPNFEAEHVISDDPWTFVELWLKRKKAIDALTYWRQAKNFCEASQNCCIEARPVPMYYAFLNASKALLEHKMIVTSADHGVSGHNHNAARSSLSTEMINFKTGGVLPGLCRYLNETVESSTYSLKDILHNIPFVHRAFQLTFSKSPELFIPLENARYVSLRGSREAWFEADVLPRFADGRRLTNVPDSFQCYNERGSYLIRRKKRFCWFRAQDSTLDKDKALERLQSYHASMRRIIVNIKGNRDLWYLKRSVRNNRCAHRHKVVLTFAAMHRLSELSRYDPKGLSRHLQSQGNWLLSEFISNSMDQFIDQIASEITGHQFWPTKMRP